MADGEVKIETKLDNSGFEKGAKQLDKKLKETGKQIDNTTKSSDKMGKSLDNNSKAADKSSKSTAGAAAAVSAYAAAAAIAVAMIKGTTDAFYKMAEVYKVQERSERSLAIAAENNPYISGSGVIRLKEYASEMQRITDIGDEVTLDVMAQLAATGRTEEEITKIIKAAADYSAATQTDFRQSAQMLSDTLNGATGALGKHIKEVKDLTAAELANGAAIDIIQKKYSGYAAELVDTHKQVENLKGDFQEEIGNLTLPFTQLWDSVWAGFYEKGIQAVRWLNDVLLENDAVDSLIRLGMRMKIDENGEEKMAFSAFDTTDLQRILDNLQRRVDAGKELTSQQKNAVIYIREELGYRERVADYAAKEAAEEEKKTKELERQNAIKEKANEYARDSNKKLNADLTRLDLREKLTGEKATAQERYNIILTSYIALLTETEGLIKEGYPVEQKRLEQLQAAKKALDEEKTAQEKLNAAIQATQAVIDTINNMSVQPTPSGSLRQQQEVYKDLRRNIEKLTEEEVENAQEGNEIIYTKLDLLKKLADEEKKLEDQKTNELLITDNNYYTEYEQKQNEIFEMKKALAESEVLTEEEKNQRLLLLDQQFLKNKAQLWNDITAEINGYTQETYNIAKDAAALMLEQVQTETDLELAKLDEKYIKGEIAEEEYYEEQKKIKRKAAQEEYKIKMFEWTASILAATANIAEGVSKAIAQGGVAGIITGALVSAAGGAQLASIIAAKPIPPNFWQGGYIGGPNGASMGSDNTYIHARNGELVINANQQRRLWDMLNGGSAAGDGSGGLNVMINNTQANNVNATARQQNGELYIDIVDKHINQGFKNGTYDAGVAGMRSRQEGVKIL